MTSRRPAWVLAWPLAALAAAGTVVALAQAVHEGLTWRGFATTDPWFSVVLAAAYAPLGAAILTRQRANRLGWVFVGIGVSRAVFLVATVWDDRPVASWLAFWTRFPAAAIAGLALLWFPDGRAPTRRWRAAALPAALGLISTAVIAVLSWRYRGPQLLPDAPTPPDAVAQFADALLGVLAVTGLAGVALGLAGLLRRLRGAGPVVRQQVKWYLYGAVAALVGNLAGDFLLPTAGLNLAGTLAWAAATLIAVERHQLWRIDRLINRTLVYGTLSALAAAVYVGCSAGLGLLLGGLTQGRALAIAGGTLAAAGLVAPARSVVQTTIDRWFDRRQYEAVRRVRAYADHLGSGPELRDVLAAALRDPQLRLFFTLPDGRVIDPSGAPAAPPAGLRALPGGALLQMRHFADDERALFEAVLAAAGPAVEHARLRAELRVRLAEVEASRARIVTAADQERRRVERNLHDGAQQRLVALAARLRLDQRRLDPAAAHVVESAVTDLQQAVEELRTLAQGLVPAALASEGLAVALRDLAGRHTGDVHLAAVPAHRHPPEIESAGWYVVAEGLANAQKHAAGASTRICAECTDGRLTLVISDDGPGGAVLETGTGLLGLADRVGACGGELTVTSPLGGGTRLRAVLPCG